MFERFLRWLNQDELRSQILVTLSEQHKTGLTLGKELNCSIGILYPILHSMEKANQICSYWGEERPPERGGSRRRYYHIPS